MKKAVEEKFSDQYPLHKEDCIGHIQKRMGATLHNYKNKSKGSKLSDGKGVGGTGRLTDSTIDRMQNIVIQFAVIRVTQRRYKKQYMILGPESESNDKQHQFCPKTPDSWCKY